MGSPRTPRTSLMETIARAWSVPRPATTSRRRAGRLQPPRPAFSCTLPTFSCLLSAAAADRCCHRPLHTARCTPPLPPGSLQGRGLATWQEPAPSSAHGSTWQLPEPGRSSAKSWLARRFGSHSHPGGTETPRERRPTGNFTGHLRRSHGRALCTRVLGSHCSAAYFSAGSRLRLLIQLQLPPALTKILPLPRLHIARPWTSLGRAPDAVPGGSGGVQRAGCSGRWQQRSAAAADNRQLKVGSVQLKAAVAAAGRLP